MGGRMRLTKSQTKERRSHHALEGPRLAKCPDCGELHLRHRVCENCGKYRGRVVIDVEKERLKKEKKVKDKKKEMEQAGIKKESPMKDSESLGDSQSKETPQKEVKPLDAAKLSDK